MSFRRQIINFFSSIQRKKFETSCKDPERSQKKLWQQTYNFIHQHHPLDINKTLKENEITEVEVYTKYFNPELNTQLNPLTKEKVLFWAQSAGTTGKQKIFPLTKKYQKQFQTSIAPFLNGIINNYSNFLNTKSLYLAATDPEEMTKGNLPIGFISNYNYHQMPGFIKSAYALPDSALKNGETYNSLVSLYSLAHDLGAIFAVTPLSINKFLDNIITNWHILIQDLKAGKVKIGEDRLKYLESLDFKKLTCKTLWPKMEFICCWKSSICQLQLKNMEHLTQGIDIIDAIYSATEGWINVPDLKREFGGPIHPDVHVLEFIEVGKDIIKNNLINMWELEVGKEYEVFITNMMGLIRYRIKDIVKCVDFYYRSPVIHFVRKVDSEISLGLVTISENELVQLSKEYELPLSENEFFTPNSTGDGLVYCSEDNSGQKLKNIHSELQKVNVNYGTYTKSGTIKELTWQKIRAKDIVSHAQTKPKYLFQKFPQDLVVD